MTSAFLTLTVDIGGGEGADFDDDVATLQVSMSGLNMFKQNSIYSSGFTYDSSSQSTIFNWCVCNRWAFHAFMMWRTAITWAGIFFDTVLPLLR